MKHIKSKKKTAAAMLLVVLALLALLLGALLLDSKYDLQLTEYELGFEALPPEFDGFRVVQLSDLHGMSFGTDNEGLCRLVREADPDIIVMTGDMLGRSGDLTALRPLVEGLSSLAPIYYVTGNHEWALGCVHEVCQLMEEYGATPLRNQYERLSHNGSHIVIAGVEDPKCPEEMPAPDQFAAQLRRDCGEDFVLLLAHRNSLLRLYPRLPVELILCGHAHGGIIRLPGIGGLIDTDRSLIARYDAGMYRGESYVMEVSRGLGNSVFVPRFLNRPELVALTLRRAAED